MKPDRNRVSGMKEANYEKLNAKGFVPKETPVKSGDVIIEFDGKTIKDTRELVRIVGDSPVGKQVSVKVLRDGKKVSLSVKLGRLEDNIATGQPSRQRTKKIEFAG